MERKAHITRNTSETQISLTLNLDCSGRGDIRTGIGFFDHMLNSFARHGFFDLELQVTGDLEVDTHHTVEDVGIVLGQAIREALGDKKGIVRYGSPVGAWYRDRGAGQRFVVFVQYFSLDGNVLGKRRRRSQRCDKGRKDTFYHSFHNNRILGCQFSVKVMAVSLNAVVFSTCSVK